MKKYIFLFMLACLAVSGCGKKESQQAMLNADSLSVEQADSLMAQPADENKKDITASALPVSQDMAQNVVVNNEAAPLVENMPVASEAVSDTPDDISIQKALKNAGYYNGAIDGDIGKKTKAAIKEFQAKNGLHADGKVGPKTWSLLSKYVQG